MKDENDLKRSRNARLNLARRKAEDLVAMLRPDRRPDNEEAWSVLFAEARDCAADIHQGVHEAVAYHNSYVGHREADGDRCGCTYIPVAGVGDYYCPHANLMQKPVT